MIVADLLLGLCLWLWQCIFPKSPNCRRCGYELDTKADMDTCPKCNATEPHKSGVALVGCFVFGAILFFVLVFAFG